jgi:5-oxopent-3-ene-1,2,5-tricarboxylate decarboxylase/2-hydroxyhepta-2,4-diene-1,7-dioate isomerase
MRLARIRRSPDGPVELVAGLDGDQVVSLHDIDGCGDADPVAALARLGVDAVGEAVGRLVANGATVLPEPDLLFEPPVATCTKVCCLALNYAAHAAESRLELPPDPVLFFKPPSALAGHGAVVRPPARTKHVEHEVELAVVIGRVTRDLPADQWRSAVAGYTVINDMTARDLQLANLRRNQPWDQSKAFDTFAPLGPYLVTPDEVPDPHDLRMRLTVAGQVRQEANTSQMVFDIPRLLADLSDGMTLLPGDVIATGTTAGIAPLADGDVMHAEIPGVGRLVNRIEWSN